MIEIDNYLINTRSIKYIVCNDEDGKQVQNIIFANDVILSVNINSQELDDKIMYEERYLARRYNEDYED